MGHNCLVWIDLYPPNTISSFSPTNVPRHLARLHSAGATRNYSAFGVVLFLLRYECGTYKIFIKLDDFFVVVDVCVCVYNAGCGSFRLLCAVLCLFVSYR